MRTTLEIDEALLDEALRVSGERTKTAVIESALKALVARALLLRAMDDAGGTYADAAAARRRRGRR